MHCVLDDQDKFAALFFGIHVILVVYVMAAPVAEW